MNNIFSWFFGSLYVFIAFAVVYFFFFKVVPLVIKDVKWTLLNIIQVTLVLGGIAILIGCVAILAADWIFGQVLDTLPRTRMAHEINRVSSLVRVPTDDTPLTSGWSIWSPSSTTSEDTSATTATGNPLDAATGSGAVASGSTAPTAPVETRPLKPNALDLWTSLMKSTFSSGNVHDNQEPMVRRMIPEGVVCEVFSTTTSLGAWVKSKASEDWVLRCSQDNFKTLAVEIPVNGTAARGLTGGEFYTNEAPATVYGNGVWPEICYEAVAATDLSSVQSGGPVVSSTGGTVTPNSNSGKLHTVMAGESLGSIADKYGISTKALVNANLQKHASLQQNPNIVQPGWELMIP